MSALSANEGSPTSERSERGDIVTFDVGGRIFKVMKEPTLSNFPESLLNTLAAEREGDEPIFVDADPDLFRYILAYHRHREILIPYTVSKEAVLREAEVMRLNVKPEEICREELPIVDAFGAWTGAEAELRETLKNSAMALVALKQMRAGAVLQNKASMTKTDFIQACAEQTTQAFELCGLKFVCMAERPGGATITAQLSRGMVSLKLE